MHSNFMHKCIYKDVLIDYDLNVLVTYVLFYDYYLLLLLRLILYDIVSDTHFVSYRFK